MYSLCIDDIVQQVIQLSRCEDSFGVGILMSQILDEYTINNRLTDLGLDILVEPWTLP